MFLDPKLDGGGLHQIFKGGYLNVHTDFSSHTNKPNWTRVLNILIYLNKNWKESYKGNLELWSKDGRKKISEISLNLIDVCFFLQTKIVFMVTQKN